MSNLVYPSYIPGVKFVQKKTSAFNTSIQTSLTGKTSRLSNRAFPLYSWELQYEFLQSNAARTNQVLYSQDLTQWSHNFSGAGVVPIVSGNFAQAPDGTLTASRVILNIAAGSTVGDYSQVYTSMNADIPVGGAVTESIWLRSTDGVSTQTVLLNSNLTGVVQIISVGPAWRRFTVTGNGISSSAFIGLILQGNYAAGKYADVLAWGAQIELGSITSGYIPTFGAAVRTSDLKTLTGFFNQMMGQQDTFLYQDPDFNTVQQQQFGTGNGTQTAWQLTATYQPGDEIAQFGQVLGYAGLPELIQNTNGAPQIFLNRYGLPELCGSASRTNGIWQSQTFDNATWGKTGCTVTTAATTAPDGTTTGELIAEDTSTGEHVLTQSHTPSGVGAVYTMSVFLKPGTRTQAQVQYYQAGDAFNAIVDLSALTVTATASGTLQLCGIPTLTACNNGWHRVSVTFQVGSATAHTMHVGNALAGSFSYTGTSGDGIYVWGAQVESGLYATKYIPTTTASVTAVADYSIGPTGLVTFAAAPANTNGLYWTGSFYYRCRFSADMLDTAQMYSTFWEAKSVKFDQVKL